MRTLYESLFSASKPENIKNLMFLDTLKKIAADNNIIWPGNQFDNMKSNSYYDEKTTSMHIGFEGRSSGVINIHGLSNLYKIFADDGVIINNIMFENFTGRISITGDYKTYDGRNQISKISSKTPMALSLYSGKYKNMDLSEMKLITNRSAYGIENTVNIYDSTLSNINLGSHPKNSLYVSSTKVYNTGPLLFNNVTGEFRDIHVTIDTYNSPRYDKKISEACFIDFDPTTQHYDGNIVKVNPDILINLGLNKLKYKKMNIEIAINHKKNGYFSMTVVDGIIKPSKFTFRASR